MAPQSAHPGLADRVNELIAAEAITSAEAISRVAEADGITTAAAKMSYLRQTGRISTPHRTPKKTTVLQDVTDLLDCAERAAIEIARLKRAASNQAKATLELQRQLADRKDAAELEALRDRFRQAVRNLNGHLPVVAEAERNGHHG